MASYRGTAGADAITGSGKDDSYVGGWGDDTLAGGYGADTYVYRKGDGNDVVKEHWYSWDPAQANCSSLRI